MQEKVLVLDIDGTLTNSKKEITEATKQGIWNILQHGHKVILASGRPTPGMRKCEEELELKKYGGYLLSFNGARIVECKTGEVVYQRTLPLSIVPGLYEFAKANGCGLITYQGEGVISAFEPDKYVQLEARINGIPIQVVDDFVSYVDFDINKCPRPAASLIHLPFYSDGCHIRHCRLRYNCDVPSILLLLCILRFHRRYYDSRTDYHHHWSE